MVQIVKSSFEILTPIDADFVLRHIERCGRTCYQSFDKADETSHLRFLKHIVSRHHESVIEHFSVSVKFIMDRAIANELVRHRLASFSQESTRYCCYAKDKFGNEISVIKPVMLDENSPAYQTWYRGMEQIEQAYLKMLDEGQTPETARSVLPCCLKTEIVVSANLREWKHIFSMRCSEAAHPDIRFLMRDLKAEFQKHIPIIFDDEVNV